jgi:hypothetical protein
VYEPAIKESSLDASDVSAINLFLNLPRIAFPVAKRQSTNIRRVVVWRRLPDQ